MRGKLRSSFVMPDEILIKKDAEHELPIPAIWRHELKKIADYFVQKNAQLPKTVRSLEHDITKINRGNLDDYPDKIILLSEKTWETSIYLWHEHYWQVLLDLTAEGGESSDLVLHLRVYENDDGFEFEVGLIYVP